ALVSEIVRAPTFASSVGWIGDGGVARPLAAAGSMLTAARDTPTSSARNKSGLLSLPGPTRYQAGGTLALTVKVRRRRRLLSDRYTYFPGVSLRFQVAFVFARIPVFRFTPGPVRWKFCVLTESVMTKR